MQGRQGRESSVRQRAGALRLNAPVVNWTQVRAYCPHGLVPRVYVVASGTIVDLIKSR